MVEEDALVVEVVALVVEVVALVVEVVALVVEEDLAEIKKVFEWMIIGKEFLIFQIQ